MGSMIHLSIGELDIDWGKNRGFFDHSPLFQTADVTKVPYRYVDDDSSPIVEYKQGYSRALKHVLTRLDLLGCTTNIFPLWFKNISDDHAENPFIDLDVSRKLCLDDILEAFKHLKIDKSLFVPDIYIEANQILSEALLRTSVIQHHYGDFQEIGLLLRNIVESLHPWLLLRLLAQNLDNLDLNVIWGFADIVENGWVEREHIVKHLSNEQQFLIVTEGSTDANIIQKSLHILRPDIADFFRFVDMSEGYPFSGTGNLYNFCKGLISIGYPHPTLFVYDNDAEGTAKCLETQKLSLLPNMRVIKLPNLEEFKKFRTIGPHRHLYEDINCKAAAIECYLDLELLGSPPMVRWILYNQKIDSYHGVLVDKEYHAKKFFEIKRRIQSYNFSKLELLLQHLISTCIEMATFTTLTRDDY